jgi:hypothetical protein
VFHALGGPPEPEPTRPEPESAAIGAAPTDPAQAEADAEPTSAQHVDAAIAPVAEPGVHLVGLGQRHAYETMGPDLPSLILIDPNAPMPDLPDELPEIPRDPAHAARPAAPAPPRPSARFTADSELAERLTPRRTARLALPGLSRRFWPWLSLLLLITLSIQLVHLFADPLVQSMPALRPVIAPLCAQTGCTLNLPQRPGDIQIVGSELQPGKRSDRLTLTLTLANRNGKPLAWPGLDITLIDARNRPVARRIFTPAEYLRNATQRAGGLPPGETTLQLSLQNRSATASGYQVKITR